MRVKIIYSGFFLLFAVIFTGLFFLQVIKGGSYRLLSEKNCVRLMPQEGTRGKILDLNGKVIVDNNLSYEVTLLPQKNEKVDSTLEMLAKALGRNPAVLKKSFRQNLVSSYLPVTVASNIGTHSAIILEELKADYPEISVATRPLRHYSYGKLASHLIGYLGEIDRWRLTRMADYGYNTKDIVGFTGVEERYDYYLRQEEGGTSIEVDHRGRFVRILGYKPPQNGKDIILTIDLEIQKIAENCIGDKKGSVIIMDPFSGAIRAMVSRPGFQAQSFVQKDQAAIKDLFSDESSPLLNRAISTRYPPGSVFKMVVAAAALETAKINPSTTHVCEGYYQVGKQKFNCWSSHGIQDLMDAIANSCNNYFYQTGLSLGGQAIHDYAVKFGFGKPTNIDIFNETQGIVPSPFWKKFTRLQGWYNGDTANFSIGQGYLLVTPLQVVRMIAVFANNGFLVTPHVVAKIGGQDTLIWRKKPSTVGLKQSTLEAINAGMRKTITSGTGAVMAQLPVEVAGKTGTAQVFGSRTHGWFTGFFPYKKPRFVICVFLENGGPGANASMMAKDIIDQMCREGLV